MATSTVSAFTGNDTYIDIAKIEGSETYKAYMLCGPQQRDPVQYPYCPFSRPTCQQYWPFTTVTQPANPLAPILHALVAAAGSVLERPVESVLVSIHAVPPNRWYETRVNVQSALDSIQVYSWEHLARTMPAQMWPLGLRGICTKYIWREAPEYRRDPAKLVLNVEYMRQSLVASLWEEECGDVQQFRADYYRRRHDDDYYPRGPGYDAREVCLNGNASDPDAQFRCDEDFKSELRKLLRSSIQGPRIMKTPAADSQNRTIDAVILTGERAGDKSITTALREILPEFYTNGATVDLSLARTFSPDLTFVGSRTAAWEERREKIMRRRQAIGDPRDL
jgi:hypothetical protein